MKKEVLVSRSILFHETYLQANLNFLITPLAVYGLNIIVYIRIIYSIE